MKQNLLHTKIKTVYGDILSGCVAVSKLIKEKQCRRVSPETIRRACYSQKISARLAMDLIAVLGFKLEDLRRLKPDMFEAARGGGDNHA